MTTPPQKNSPLATDRAAGQRGVGAHGSVGTLLRITRIALQRPWWVAISFASTLVAATLQLMIPIILGIAVDQTQGAVAASEGARTALVQTAALLFAMSFLRGVFTTLQNYFGEAVGHAVGYELRRAYYAKVQELDFSFHDKVHSGDLITLGMLDLEGVRMFFSTGIVRLLLLSTLIGVGGYILISTDLVLALAALSFVPFVGWRSAVTRLRLRATWLRLQERLSILSRVMEENLAGIRVVRAFAAQPLEMAKFHKSSLSALELARERVGIRVRNTSAMTFSFFAAMGLVLWIGGRQVIAGEISVGTLASFLTFMTILQMPVRQLGMLVNSFARASTCGSRLFDFLDFEVPIREEPGAPALALSEGRLSFEDVSFTYRGTDRPVLRNVSFEARRGETIGLVGPPGSGKSSLVHLIPRFYDVTGGSITIDGQDIRAVSLRSLRQAVAVVQQDVFLFTTTLENNIAYANPWAREKQVERASEAARLHDYILNLPSGYHTVVGERGVSLSGGQRQRVSIARTLMLQPSILIFDDSTTALDANTERSIRKAMRENAASRVTVIIAHRLSSLMDADRILVLEEGRIVEEGGHDELVALGGRYRELHDLQVGNHAPTGGPQ